MPCSEPLERQAGRSEALPVEGVFHFCHAAFGDRTGPGPTRSRRAVRRGGASSRRPCGAGSRAASVLSCGSGSAPQGDGSSSPAIRAATAATCSRLAAGPTQRTAAPPGRTRGRHHSAAVGGCARAFARATPAQSVGCSSARPQTTRAFGGAHCSRNSRLSPLGLEQHDFASRQRERERDAGRAAAGADIDDRPLEPLDELRRTERVVREHPAGLVEVGDRRQARRRDDGLEPRVESLLQAGRTTT